VNDVPLHELLSAYLDGELTAAERAAVEQVLAADPQARQWLDELRALSHTLRALPRHKLDEDLSRRVLEIAERRILTGSSTDGAAATGAVYSSSPGPLASRVQPVKAVARPPVVPPHSHWRGMLSRRALFWSGLAVAIALVIRLTEPPSRPPAPKDIAAAPRREQPARSAQAEAKPTGADQLAERAPAAVESPAAESPAMQASAFQAPSAHADAWRKSEAPGLGAPPSPAEKPPAPVATGQIVDAAKRQLQLARPSTTGAPLARNAAAVDEKAPAADRALSKLKDNVAASEQGKFNLAEGRPAQPSTALPSAAAAGETKPAPAAVLLRAAPRPAAPPAAAASPVLAGNKPSAAALPAVAGNMPTGKGSSAGLLAGQGRRLNELGLQSEISSAASDKAAPGRGTEVHLEVTAEAVQTHVFEDLLAHSGAILQIPKSLNPQIPKSPNPEPSKPADRGDAVALAEGVRRQKRGEESLARPPAGPGREALQPVAPPTILVYQVDATPEQLRKLLAQLAQNPAVFSAVTVRPSSAAKADLSGNGFRAGIRRSAGTDARGGAESRSLAMGRGSAAVGDGRQARKAAEAEPAAGAVSPAEPSPGAKQEKAASAAPPAPAQRVVFILRVLAPAHPNAAKP
jgi:hypothetical protein